MKVAARLAKIEAVIGTRPLTREEISEANRLRKSLRQSAAQKARYRNDPEYRAHRQARSKARYVPKGVA